MKRKYKLFNSKSSTSLRRRLRSNFTKSEELIWRIVRNNHLGFKFSRQYGIGAFVVDFCSPELKLIVEIDGETHYNDVNYIKDQQRQKYLENVGFTVKRYTGEYVLNNPEGLHDDLKAFCGQISHYEPSPYPLPGRERGL